MIIPIEDNTDKILRIGKELYETSPETYTPEIVSWMRKTINESDYSNQDEEEIFLISVYDYCLYGVKLNDWIKYSFYGKSHLYKLQITEECEKQRLLSEALILFGKDNPSQGSLKDYKQALELHIVSYREYMYQYKFWSIDETERSNYISAFSALQYYRRLIIPDIKNLFTNKKRFLETFKDFVHRKYIDIKACSYEEFRDFVSSNECLVKPMASSGGRGIFKIALKNELDVENLYKQLVNGNYIIEQCVTNIDSIKAFHPSSLNTIRIVTLSNNDKVLILKSIIRFGVKGSVIDNTHTGGIFAQINIEQGYIESDGIDICGNIYKNHPDTDMPFKGFCIPQWEEIKRLCLKACMVNSDIHIAGWDLAVLDDGQIELIEGNYAPDFDGGMQMPLAKGCKNMLYSRMHQMFNL